MKILQKVFACGCKPNFFSLAYGAIKPRHSLKNVMNYVVLWVPIKSCTSESRIFFQINMLPNLVQAVSMLIIMMKMRALFT